MESILKSGNSRFTVFPIKYQNLWKFYKQHISTFWTVEEIKLVDDIVDWNDKLNENERYFIKNILAFFAASDGIVNENLVVNFYNEVEIPEARQFYAVQMMIEAIHGEMYSLLIDTYISNTEEKDRLFKAIDTIPAVKRKAEWAIKWMQKDKSNTAFAQRLLAFVCVEGIFFSGSFCAIYWLKSRGLMPGLSTANSFISRDENLHSSFAIELYKMLENRLDEKVVHDIFKEAVEIEKEFITESLPVSLIGMNCNLMSQYIEMVADRWLVLLGYSKIYNTPNPFPFMEMISLNEKVNFFENVVTNYQRANVGASEEDRKITFDSDDF
jgi:ribonucleoside-diphosphate reductase beta chain